MKDRNTAQSINHQPIREGEGNPCEKENCKSTNGQQTPGAKGRVPGNATGKNQPEPETGKADDANSGKLARGKPPDVQRVEQVRKYAGRGGRHGQQLIR